MIQLKRDQQQNGEFYLQKQLLEKKLRLLEMLLRDLLVKNQLQL
ncbi:MAG: hypothetical protein ACI9QD_001217 [Thermoproteota archaeon]|jgi:hypothetical protein